MASVTMQISCLNENHSCNWGGGGTNDPTNIFSTKEKFF